MKKKLKKVKRGKKTKIPRKRAKPTLSKSPEMRKEPKNQKTQIKLILPKVQKLLKTPKLSTMSILSGSRKTPKCQRCQESG